MFEESKYNNKMSKTYEVFQSELSSLRPGRANAAMLDIVKKWVPLTYEAFEDYRIGGTELSAKEVNLMRKLLKGEKVSFEEEGLSKREWSELQRKFEIS